MTRCSNRNLGLPFSIVVGRRILRRWVFWYKWLIWQIFIWRFGDRFCSRGISWSPSKNKAIHVSIPDIHILPWYVLQYLSIICVMTNTPYRRVYYCWLILKRFGWTYICTSSWGVGYCCCIRGRCNGRRVIISVGLLSCVRRICR